MNSVRFVIGFIFLALAVLISDSIFDGPPGWFFLFWTCFGIGLEFSIRATAHRIAKEIIKKHELKFHDADINNTKKSKRK